jgi:uncharacterized phage infection (PIP) family protein YhgE
MDDLKSGYRETEETAKETWRKADGEEDLADKVGNLGDDIRKELGNLGDDAENAADNAADRSNDPRLDDRI